jgi:hypothetical protein
MLAHHIEKWKKLVKYYLFLDLAPLKIHNHAYNLGGIYFEKTWYKHKWHLFLHNSRQPTTMALYINVFYITLWWDILIIPQVIEFLDFLPCGMSVHFIPYRKDKIRRLDDEGSTHLWNIGLLWDYMALYPRKLSSLTCKMTEEWQEKKAERKSKGKVERHSGRSEKENFLETMALT